MYKNFFLELSVGIIALAFSASTQAMNGTPPETRDVVVGVSDVFVPGGFDSEADAFVVVSGLFPNGCYRWKGAEIVNVNALTHQIQSKATVSQGMCIMVLVPFSKEIRLGKLSAGNHTLRFVNGDGTYLERSLKVE